ncbi:molybdenum cofactor guanylyltransferase [Candidatus Bathyarchaeota archaeon]|nr:MAG: molybdenum cofactor guanylyltransferase [Candidatus Bathyarchaeota archaeon]
MNSGVIILAGGKGSRIGGKKAFITLSNRPLIHYIHSIALEISNEIIIVTSKEDKNNRILKQLPGSPKIIHDLCEDVGPLMGIYSGLRATEAEKCLILPCDTPLANTDLLKFLVQSANGYDAVIPRWPNGFIEPLHSVFDVNKSIIFIEASLSRGEKRINDLIKQFELINYISINTLRKYDPELLTFNNINYLEDLKMVEKTIRKK